MIYAILICLLIITSSLIKEDAKESITSPFLFIGAIFYVYTFFDYLQHPHKLKFFVLLSGVPTLIVILIAVGYVSYLIINTHLYKLKEKWSKRGE